MRKYFIPIFLLCLFTGVAMSLQTEQPQGIAITDARLGRDVKDRAIVDEDSTFELNAKAFFWFKAEGAASDSLTVTWTQGDYSHEVKLFIGGSPWRTWSAKMLTRKGDWTVSVAGPDGKILRQVGFKVR